MSRYYSLLIFILFFTSCSSKSASDFIAPSLSTNSLNRDINKTDLYMLYALDAQYLQEYDRAAEYFEKLYHSDKKVLYIQEAIKNRILLKEYQKVKQLLDEGLHDYPNSSALKRYLAAYYLDLRHYKEAEQILTKLVKKEDNASDKALLASAQLGSGKVKKALRYYQKAYQKDKTPASLIPLVNILYYDLGKKSKAKRLLHTHIDFIGCDEVVCYKLLEIYQKEKDVKNLTLVAEKLYTKTKKMQFAKIVLDIYAYEKDYDGAIRFLEKHHIDDAALLELYVIQKKYPKAIKLATKLYHDTGDLHYLAQMAMSEYESSPTPVNQKRLQSIQKKFDKVVKTLDNPSYNNFYGYILIDHELNVDRGIRLIKRALKKSPNAPFFIDSLAWGYYKKGECQKAYDTIFPIKTLVKEPEIQDHIQKIDQCHKGTTK